MDKFVFFGGKGGVGKTTISSAYGLKCARAGLDTLVVSTDPAHSTSDVFDQQFDDDPSAVDGHDHLWAMEIDPDEEIEAHMQDIKRRMSEQVSASIVNEIDRQIELAHRTPGAYEAALFDRFIEVMRAAQPAGAPQDERAADAASSEAERSEASETASGEDGPASDAERWDRVVFDTSPTGGTLRLLALPEFLESWIGRLVDKRKESIDLFEKAAIGNQEARRKIDEDPLIAHLIARKEKFEFAGRVLRNEAAFFLVLNPDELSIRETSRAVEELSGQGLTVDGLVINRVTPGPDDDEQGRGAQYLRDRIATERERIDQIQREFEQPVVATIESRVREIKGDLLADVAGELDVPVESEARSQSAEP